MVVNLTVLDALDVDRLEVDPAVSWSDAKKRPFMHAAICLVRRHSMVEHRAEVLPAHNACAYRTKRGFQRSRRTSRAPLSSLSATKREALVHFITGAMLRMLTWWLDAERRLSAEELTILFRRFSLSAIEAANPPISLFRSQRGRPMPGRERAQPRSGATRKPRSSR